MKLTKIAVAFAALAAAGSASAAPLVKGNVAGGGSLIFAAYNAATQESYIRNLGQTFDTFVTAAGLDLTTGALTGNQVDGSLKLEYAGDDLFTSTFSGTELNTLRWNVGVLKNDGGVLTGIGTVQPNTLTTAAFFVGNNLNSWNTKGAGSWIDLLNAGGALNSANSRAFTSSTTPGYTSTTSPSNVGNWFDDYGNNISYNNTAVGTSGTLESFVFTGPAGVSQTTKVALALNGRGVWSLDSTGKVTFSAAALETTPVPVPAAVWLLGSALLGLLGVSRRRAV